MLFTEPLFLFLFLPIVLGAYFASPGRLRNLILIAASLCFYAYGEGVYVLVLMFSILLNYLGGLSLIRSKGGRQRRLILMISVGSNLLLLGIFKYTNFIVYNIVRISNHLVPLRLQLPEVHLPIGISFFTFMGISYLVDVYRKQIKGETNLGNLALYITLFPHLIAGPIVRYGDIAKAIVARTIKLPQFAEGIRRFTIGFGKKMLIANTLAITADWIFQLGNSQLTTGVAWLGIVCYTLQIYYDFSGYTDMAIGLALLFGFHFPENFNYPYVATSITDFWRRWHISLSTWFRDYLFFPLGIRRPAWRVYLNLLIVFFLCGLWHGARWHFVLWGVYHGAFLVIERMGVLKVLARVATPLRHLYALLVITIGWALFRAERVGDAISYLAAMFGFSRAGIPALKLSYYLTPELILVLVIAIAGGMPTVPFIKQKLEGLSAAVNGDAGISIAYTCGLVRAVILIVVFIAATTQSAVGTYNPFIYFRF